MGGKPFEELVAEHRNNRTLEQLEIDSGGVVKWNSWHQWTKPGPNRKRTQFPQVETIRAMAVALDVTEEEVLLSLGVTLGLDIGSSDDLLIPGGGRLPALAKATLTSLAAVLMQKAEEEDGDPFEVA